MWFYISFKLKQSYIRLILHRSGRFDSIVNYIHATYID